MKPYLLHEHPLRFAHRGSRVLWPQNTMTAFQGAVDLGYCYLETDLHVSRDGRVVVFHDDGLEHLTDGAGKVWDHDWSYLRTLDAAHHFDPEHGHPRRGVVGKTLERGFYITANEVEKASSLKNYYIYFVFSAMSKEPRILPTKNPLPNPSIFSLHPSVYHVSLK